MAPPQRRLGDISSLGVALILVEPFLLKGLAQIREGLAFVAVLLPLASMYAFDQRGVVRTATGAILAAAIHFGAVIFSGAWTVAAAQALFGRRVEAIGYQRLLFVVSAAAGVGLAWFLEHDSAAIRLLMEDFGVNLSAFPAGGLVKYAYWVLNGGLVLVIRHQLLNAAGSRQFAFVYAGTLGSFVLPMLYAVCLVLVFTDFYIPALTSMVIRLLFTSMELAIIIVVFRRRANLVTLAVTLVMVADRVRLLLPTPA